MFEEGARYITLERLVTKKGATKTAMRMLVYSLPRALYRNGKKSFIW